MEFEAEIIEVKSRKSASLDVVYRLVLVTDNAQVLDLGKQPADQTFRVMIGTADGGQTDKAD